MKLTEKKIETTPLLQRVKRSNFIRAAAMEWMRINQPDLMAEIEAERQYPFTKAAVVGPLHNGPVVNATHRIARPSCEVAGTGLVQLVQIDGDG